MSLIRGILLAGKFRTQHELNQMSHDDQRNTLIVEMTKHSNQSVGHFQTLNDDTLAGVGAVMVFLRETRIRDDNSLKAMSDDNQRNTLIVELGAQTHLSGPVLQGMNNLDLVRLGLGKDNSFIRGALLAGKFRTQHELNQMSHDDQRNTLIVELTGRSNQPVQHYQGMNDATLAGTGAMLVFLREAHIRDDQALRSISDDDQRNITIVELGGQTHFPGPFLQSLTNMDLVHLALGGDVTGRDEVTITYKQVGACNGYPQTTGPGGSGPHHAVNAGPNAAMVAFKVLTIDNRRNSHDYHFDPNEFFIDQRPRAFINTGLSLAQDLGVLAAIPVTIPAGTIRDINGVMVTIVSTGAFNGSSEANNTNYFLLRDAAAHPGPLVLLNKKNATQTSFAQTDDCTLILF